ncbi:MAG TPA: ubiquinol-cytochrome C chaperone family protein [Bauldia sp.]|nr:ubiquinol-cytochrome C chaperone family protein [Bauldia sp.]
MLGRLFRRDREGQAIATALYGAIVAQARTPALYTDFAVADTVTGRFEMVVLHLILVLDRIAAEGAGEAALGQAVFDLYCTDMDRSLRELGFGDLGVPRRMKKMAQAFYGRAGAYRQAIAADDRNALAAAIARNVFPNGGGHAPQVAEYALRSAVMLAAQPIAELRGARPAFAPLLASEVA